MQPSHAAIWIRSLSKSDLHKLIAAVKRDDPDAVSRAVTFVVAESFGIWHNRARAKLCRHFKNHPPPKPDCEQLVATVTARLIDGNFYEQFKDQLSMAIRFVPSQLDDAASVALDSDRDYVRRYGRWVRHVLASQAPTHTGG